MGNPVSATKTAAPRFLSFFAVTMLLFTFPPQAQAQATSFRQAVAAAAHGDADLVAFYRARDFDGIWSKSGDRRRRNALMAAFATAGDHGLPTERYDTDALMVQLRAADTPAEQGRMEVELSRLFMQYARDVQTGITVPRRIDENIKRRVPYRSRLGTLQALARSNPDGFLRSLPPSAPEYTRLMREKMRLERLLAEGGWGPTVDARSLAPGASGAEVVKLRNRLIAMGFLERTLTQTYDASIQVAVQRFQQAHGLPTSGTANRSTMSQINISSQRRMQSIVVAMERERWLNRPRGQRHIWVNLTDFTAAIVDNGTVTFLTRSVIGAREEDRYTPEFSDVMEFMVINPSWYVPQQIVTEEFLPELQEDPTVLPDVELTDENGVVVDRAEIDFLSFDAETFPYAMRQPPSRGNALGLVKFMFPNRHNIYLHDTPTKSLFRREVRAFSHGCIRLNDPFDFAYALLSPQMPNPEEYFQRLLRTGKEYQVNLEAPVPIHLVYRTAFTNDDGRVQFRRDVYGRDARIWRALAREGVVIRAVRG